MLRNSAVTTLAAAAIAGGSAFVTGSEIASRTSSGLDLPGCAGSAIAARRVPGTAPAFDAPNGTDVTVSVDVGYWVAQQVVAALSEDEGAGFYTQDQQEESATLC